VILFLHFYRDLPFLIFYRDLLLFLFYSYFYLDLLYIFISVLRYIFIAIFPSIKNQTFFKAFWKNKKNQ